MATLAERIRDLAQRIAADVKAMRTRPRVLAWIACSDETTALTTGLKATFRMPVAVKVTAIRATLTTASTSGSVIVDVKFANTSPFSTKPTLAALAKMAAGVLTSTVLDVADDTEVTVTIDQAGTGAAGLKVSIVGYPT